MPSSSPSWPVAGALPTSHARRGRCRRSRSPPARESMGPFFHVETPKMQRQRSCASRRRIGHLGWAMMGRLAALKPDPCSASCRSRRKASIRDRCGHRLTAATDYVKRDLRPFWLAQPTYLWGVVGENHREKRCWEKTCRHDSHGAGPGHHRQSRPWARQLKAWGFGDVPDEYLRLPDRQRAASENVRSEIRAGVINYNCVFRLYVSRTCRRHVVRAKSSDVDRKGPYRPSLPV